MESWQVTVLIVFLYAALIMFVGTGKWTKGGTVRMDDYFKVGPGFGFIVLYLGIAGGFHTAFAIPGSMGFYYTHGVAFAANILWTVFTPLGVIYFIGSRITCLGKKFNYITPADMLADYFGDGKFRAFIAIYILTCCIPLMTANITGPAILLSSGTEGHIPYWGALTMMGIMVTIYVTTSGMRGLTWTTVAQAIWMFVAIWLAAFWCLSLIDGNLLDLFNNIKSSQPELLTLPGPQGRATPEWWLTWPVFGIALYWAILPRGFLFFYSARDVKTTRKIGLTVGIYLMALYLPALVIGFATFQLMPGLAGDASFPALLAKHAPWWGGFIIAGGLAAGMSSLDADTNANSAMLTKDVYSKFVNKDASQKHYINIGRIFMVSLVAITVFASFWKWGLVAIMIGVTASMITQLLPAVLAVTVPTGLRITKAGIVSGIITGFFVAIAVMYNGKDFLSIPIPALPEGLRFDASFWGLVFNIPVMLIVSRFTTEPDPEAVARIRKALDDEFKLN
jgi:SSS family solute:Na+ symporter|tara:strand:+ start:961 stop:2481 length:1521 start_codon:yes stop_codon:yes gene_type:complete